MVGERTTHKIALQRRSETGEYQRDVCERLTCAHVLDVARHAHDQAPIRQAVNQSLAPAFVFRSWNSRRDLTLLDCACAYRRQRTIFGAKMGHHTPAPRAAVAVAGDERRGAAHRDGGGILR